MVWIETSEGIEIKGWVFNSLVIVWTGVAELIEVIDWRGFGNKVFVCTFGTEIILFGGDLIRDFLIVRVGGLTDFFNATSCLMEFGERKRVFRGWMWIWGL